MVCVLRNLAHGDRHESRLVPTCLVLLAGMTAAVTVAADFRVAALGVSINYCDYEFHTKLISD